MNRFQLGDNSKVTCNKAEIDDSVVIGNNVQINCDSIKILLHTHSLYVVQMEDGEI